MTKLIKRIRPDDYCKLRRGRHCIVTGNVPKPPADPGPEEGSYWFGQESDHDSCSIGGLVFRVQAVQLPYLCGVTVTSQGNLSAGTVVMIDLRKYTLGFVSQQFVDGIKGAYAHGQRIRSQKGLVRE